MVTQAELEAAIHEKVGQINTLFVADVSGGCGQAYDVVLVSDQFEGMPTLKRHRLVNDRLKDEIAAMHAFSQKTYTTQQFAELRSKYAHQNPSVMPASGAAAPAPAAPTPQTGPADSVSGGAPPLVAPMPHAAAPGVLVPELRLTPDESGPRIGAAGASAIERGSSPVDMHVPQRVPASVPGISRLHYNRISSVEFWLNLRKELEEQFLHADAMDLDSPGTASPSASRRPPGEAEVERLFEDFFLTQKHHLSASDIARIRDATGMLGMAGA
ncbi:hypothetical protein MBRA1_001401 [Malassezia brasiliensis]|uniref:Bola-like protein n=1 Tax=Malassezia brasiliensis TaxID=1821822 RepID=A0AAF0DSU7_9BASI|nr:hypothetical protein MBRA1_001401 [Malassezia brasiliensis]